MTNTEQGAPPSAADFQALTNAIKETMVNRPDYAQGFKHTLDVANVPFGANPFNTTGMFTNPYMSPELWSAIPNPMSFAASLPLEQATSDNELVSILTGVSDAVGENPDNVCGDPVTPGDLAMCTIVNRFGQFFMGSKAINVTELGKTLTQNYDIPTVQNWASDQMNPFIPEPLRMPNVNFANHWSLFMYELVTALMRQIARIEIDGNRSLAPANTEAGWISEFNGLSRLIRNGITSADGETCPAVDSLVATWDAAAGGTVAIGGRDYTMPTLLHDIYFAQNDLAYQVGTDGTTFEWVMDKRLYRDVVFLMSCSYALARCGNADAGTPLTRQAEAVQTAFNAQYNGRYLDIGGTRVPVRFTAGIESTHDGETNVYTGRIFLVPRRWNGRNLIKLQYFPHDNAAITSFLQTMGNSTAMRSTNNGLYLWAQKAVNYCVQLLVTAQMRMKLDTPFLAARIDGVDFESSIGIRSAFPGTSEYYGGGTTQYTLGPTFPNV